MEHPRAARERAMDRPMPLVAPLSGIRMVDWLTEKDARIAQAIGVGCVMLLYKRRESYVTTATLPLRSCS